MRVASLRERVIFEREDADAVDELGDRIGGWVTIGEVWGRLEPLRGDERIAASALAASFGYRLHVRETATTRAVTEADRVTVDGTPFQIRSIFASEAPGTIRMTVERGVAT